jgi:hypothetical protein
MRFLFTLVAAVLLIGGRANLPAEAQSPVDDEFDEHDLNWRYWCPCQIDMKNAPVELAPNPDGSNDGIARITVNEGSLGGNVCRYKSECRSPANSRIADYGRRKAWNESRPSKPSGLSVVRAQKDL